MHFKSIRQTQRALQRGEITISGINKKSLERMKQVQHLNAFISQKEDDGIDISYTGKPPPLSGIPFAIKDNFSSKQFLTTCASKMLKDYKPPYNATVIQKLVDAGANLIGKTNMDEFAMGSGSVDSIYGPVRNPWTPGILTKGDDEPKDWHITGGSSGGSAVAVATGACSFALGSDTGGSVRNPASHCGLVGLKPTYGLVSRHGLISLMNSMDVPAIFARTVDDAALVLDILKGQDINDSTTIDVCLPNLTRPEANVKGLRVGIPKECLVEHMSPEVVGAWKWAADEFADAGAHVEQVSLPNMRHSIVCYHVLCAAEVASNMARFDGIKYGHRSGIGESTDEMFAVTRREGFNDTVRSRVLAGNYFLLKKNAEIHYRKARQVRRLITQDYKNVFEHGLALANGKKFTCDILLSPAVLADAPTYSEFIREDNRTRCAEQDVLTQSINMAGIPAISVPVGISSNALPIGLQISGTHFTESKLLKAAAYLEMVAAFTNLEPRFREGDLLPKAIKYA